MPKGSENIVPQVLLTEGIAPATAASGTYPGIAAGKQAIFIDTADHKLKRVNSSGTVVNIESAVGITPNIIRTTKTANDDTLSSTTSQTDFPHLSLSITIVAGSSLRIRTMMSFTTQVTGHVNLWVKLVAGGTTYTALRSNVLNNQGASAAAYYSDEVIIATPGAATYTVTLAYQLSTAGNLLFRTSTIPGESVTLLAEEIPASI